MPHLVKKMFGINLLVMRILGFYPTRKYRLLYKSYSFVVYCFFTVLIPILSSFYFVVDPEINMEKIAEGAFITCQMICAVFKLIPFLLNDNEIRRVVYMIQHPVFTTHTKQQRKILENCEKTCKGISLLFLNSCLVCFVSWTVTPLFKKGYKLPMDIWLPFEFSDNIGLYLMSFVYLVAGVANSAFSNGAIDTLIAGLAYYASSQIKILKNNLKHLGEEAKQFKNNKSEVNEREKFEVIYNQIERCVRHHNKVIEFVEIYEKIYSPVVFIQFSASVLVICICCYRLSQIELFSVDALRVVTYLMTMLSEIFLYCFFGTTLCDENATLAQAVYMGKWYEYDIKSQKALMILMERSKRPMIVTAGKILDLSLETFTTILRRAYSLLAVLKNY